MNLSWHPISLAIVVLQVVSLALVVWSASQAIRVVLGWDPGKDTKIQMDLEKRVKGGTITARWGWWLFAASCILLTVHVAGILPDVVRGAMCGTGVLQAAGPGGPRALVMSLITVAALGAHGIVEGLNRRSPTGVLTPLASRLLLAAVPVMVLAVWAVTSMLASIDSHEPVGCCAALYEAGSVGAGSGLGGVSPRIWMALLGVSTIIVSWAAARTLWRPRSRAAKVALAVAGPLWVIAAYGALIHVLAAYHYEVLNHQCPWCLLVIGHGLVGYPIFGSMVVVGLRGPAALVADLATAKHPELSAAGTERARVSASAVLLAVIVYLLFAVVPALAWRFEFGTWM